MKLGILMEAAQTHQSLVEGALERLRTHTGELDAVVRDEIRRTLVEELQMLAAETKGATQSLRVLRRAANIHVAAWSIGITALCGAMVIVVILIAMRWLLPSREEMAALRSQHEELVLAITRLQERGGRIDLRRCGDTGRYCVRVDRKAPVFGQRADYFVLAGY